MQLGLRTKAVLLSVPLSYAHVPLLLFLSVCTERQLVQGHDLLLAVPWIGMAVLISFALMVPAVFLLPSGPAAPAVDSALLLLCVLLFLLAYGAIAMRVLRSDGRLSWWTLTLVAWSVIANGFIALVGLGY